MSKLFKINIDLNLDEGTLIEECNLDDINARALPLIKDIRRGDVVFFEEFGEYRNDGKLIYDGEKLITLADDEDDYGHLPSEFTINEFNAHYFRDVIAHNRLVWARFDSYTIDGDIIKAKMRNTNYTIIPHTDGIDCEFTPDIARRIMSYGAFEYSDDSLILEYFTYKASD